jgi:hypothetical protein
MRSRVIGSWVYYRFESKTYEIGDGAGMYTFNSRPGDVLTYVGRLTWKVD